MVTFYIEEKLCCKALQLCKMYCSLAVFLCTVLWPKNCENWSSWLFCEIVLMFRLYGFIDSTQLTECLFSVTFAVLTDSVNCLVANGLQFSHPLHHLGKTAKDLPVLAIDSFRHMYVWRHSPQMDIE